MSPVKISFVRLSGQALTYLVVFLPLAARSAEPAVDYAIVVTGGELLAGAYADGHTHFLTRTLRPLGLRCTGSMCVDDKRADLEEALRFAAGKASLVIVTGGLGPTDNDVTREAISGFTRIELKEDPQALQAMARRFGVTPERLRPNLRRQIHVPVGGTYLKNAQGSAIGLVFQADDVTIVALPGPPRELQAMVRNELVPYLSRRFGTREPGCSLTLRFVGLGQSQIDQTMEEHVPLAADVTVSSQFEGSRVDFTFSLPDDSPRDRARLDELKQKILKHLGDHVYADEETSLEQCIVKLLQKRGATLAIVEAGSGGTLAAGLAGADDSGRVIAGAYVAATGEQLRRLLRIDERTWQRSDTGTGQIELLASTAAKTTASDWVIAVGPPRQDAQGGHYLEVVFRPPDGPAQTRRIETRGPSARSRLSTQVLDLFRRRLR